MINIILLLVLAYESLSDIKKQRIRVIPLVVVGIAGVLVRMICENTTWVQLVISILPGCVLLFTGWITHQSIGYGAGIVMLVIGLCNCWRLKKRGRKAKIALCPYILLGTVISMILGVR